MSMIPEIVTCKFSGMQLQLQGLLSSKKPSKLQEQSGRRFAQGQSGKGGYISIWITSRATSIVSMQLRCWEDQPELMRHA